MHSIFYVFLGGGIGSICRFGISKLLLLNFESKLPLGTLSANVLSCILMGITLSFYKQELLSSEVLKPLILVGFCGGFSTFSTFSIETLELLKQGFTVWAIANVVVSISLCISILYFLVK